MSKTYTGPRTITVEFHPFEDQSGRRTFAHYESRVDGRTYYGLYATCADREATTDPGDTKAAAKARKSAENLAARWDRDLAVRSRCIEVMGYDDSSGNRDATAADFFVGQKVSIYSRGRRRIGIVDKVGRTNVTVVYTTPSNPGAITEKADKFENIAILETAEPVHVATDDVPCKRCGGPTMAPYTGKDGYRYEGYYCETCADLTFPAPRTAREKLGPDFPTTDPVMQRQMDNAEAKRQAEIARHIADGTEPGYGCAPGDEYCRPCGRYHGPGACEPETERAARLEREIATKDGIDTVTKTVRERLAERVANGLVTTPLACGHQSEPVHPASSVFDFPHEGTLCPTCGIHQPLAGHGPEPLTAERIGHLLQGLLTERSNLRARVPRGNNERPELRARLAAVNARIDALRNEQRRRAGLPPIAACDNPSHGRFITAGIPCSCAVR